MAENTPDTTSNKFIDQLKNFFAKLSTVQRVIFVSVIVVFALALIFAFRFTSVPNYTSIYQSPLSPEDYAKVTQKLGEWGTSFDTKQDQYILVRSNDEAKTVRMKLGQEGIIPNNVKGWELFDTQSFTTTDFERNVNLRRAIIGEMTKHLKMLEDVEDVSIQVSFPKERLYADYEADITASIVITAAPYSDLLENKGKIAGIVELVAFGIPNLEKENVVVVDDKGNVLSDLLVPNYAEEDIKIAREQLRIIERERAKYIARIQTALQKSLPEDRFLVAAEVEFDWTDKSQESTELLPTVIKPDNPLTPYDDSELVLEVPVSSEETVEDYQGPAYIPEGPAGVDDNVPPGLKDQIDRFNHYTKTQTMKNTTTGTRNVTEEKAPYEIKRISISVAIDGVWEIMRDGKGNLQFTNNRKLKRTYYPVEDSELKAYENIVKGAIGYNAARGDMVVVTHIKFDRSAEFDAQDSKVWNGIQRKKLMVATAVAILLLVILVLFYRMIRIAILKHKEEKEAERLRQEQLAREAQAAVEEGVQLTTEERASQELLDNAIAMVEEHPDDAAKLLSTWIMSDEED